jgi:hypothetical protein
MKNNVELPLDRFNGDVLLGANASPSCLDENFMSPTMLFIEKVQGW